MAFCGTEFSNPAPTIKEFREKFENVAKEITCDGEKVISHNLVAEVRVTDEEGNVYKLIGLEPYILNCYCWAGIDIVVKKEEE